MCVWGWGLSLLTQPWTLQELSRCLCNTPTCKNCTQKPKNNSCDTSSYWLRVSYCFILVRCGGNTSQTLGIKQDLLNWLTSLIYSHLHQNVILRNDEHSSFINLQVASGGASGAKQIVQYTDWSDCLLRHIHTDTVQHIGTSTKGSRTRSIRGMSHTHTHTHTHRSWQTAAVRLILQKSLEFSTGMWMNNKTETWLENTGRQYQNLMQPWWSNHLLFFCCFSHLVGKGHLALSQRH